MIVSRRLVGRPSSRATTIRGSIKSFLLNSSPLTFTRDSLFPSGIGIRKKSTYTHTIVSCLGYLSDGDLFDPPPNDSPEAGNVILFLLRAQERLLRFLLPTASPFPTFNSIMWFSFSFFFCSRSDFMGCMSFSVSHVIRKVSPSPCFSYCRLAMKNASNWEANKKLNKNHFNEDFTFQ